MPRSRGLAAPWLWVFWSAGSLPNTRVIFRFHLLPITRWLVAYLNPSSHDDEVRNRHRRPFRFRLGAPALASTLLCTPRQVVRTGAMAPHTNWPTHTHAHQP
ncbi:hypothetical protein CC85DRAFT_289501 [Cutaneotrichosporon oleaginosum]|uniref:Secreted protein n=1 Tax=Cutaneotrichosporon oleaginosum TaxID=879819 RepID=A0A0J0XBP0_9TREE|nr:uncharacterized protein CC85DRAFT_289501 [Cutaneotrichosporon oleaginosum]KLT38472.1 hypothetical protein CC85DRAFT_289501 [Cutaneotrichosporon oleaginosum]TXT04003.1 hypothetical protein COLE_07700 [Cutaneotrichosporon oleaginosum]